MRRQRRRAISEERILGSSEFVDRIITGTEQQETLRLSAKISDLDSLARTVSVRQGIDEQELRARKENWQEPGGSSANWR